jgi:hypothetical protein
MSAILDIIGAMIIGGVLMLVTNNAIDNGIREFVNHNADALVQSDLSTTTQILQSDLRKVGFGISEALQASIIQTAETSHLKYLRRQDQGSPEVDTVEFIITAVDTARFIDTSIVFYGIDRIVRRSGEDPVTTRLGNITNSNVFRYLDQAGRQTYTRQAVRMVEVTLISLNPDIYLDNATLQAPNPLIRMRELKKLLRESYWRQTRVISRNLRR